MGRSRNTLFELRDLSFELRGSFLMLEPLLRGRVDRGARFRDAVGRALRVRANGNPRERDNESDDEDASTRQHGCAVLRHTGAAPAATTADTGLAHSGDPNEALSTTRNRLPHAQCGKRCNVYEPAGLWCLDEKNKNFKRSVFETTHERANATGQLHGVN